MSFDLPDDYNDVAERIREFRTKYPDGSLQQVKLDFLSFADRCWVVYTAGAYRREDDQRPGIGTAWEPVPGRTPFTRDSELQNAETAAWGRAIVAALAADTKKVASADELRNRQADRQQSKSPRPVPDVPERSRLAQQIWEASKVLDPDLDQDQRSQYVLGEAKARELDGSKIEDLRELARQLQAEAEKKAQSVSV